MLVVIGIPRTNALLQAKALTALRCNLGQNHTSAHSEKVNKREICSRQYAPFV